MLLLLLKGPRRTPEERKERDAQKYKLLPLCKCQKNCITKISEEQKQMTHDQFWEEEYSSRRAWLFIHIKTTTPARTGKFGVENLQRKTTRFYILPDVDGNDVFVCKIFFLRTLGYKSDKIVTATLNSLTPGSITTPKDRQGQHTG